jgi:FtsP/CotA-like multicopper oxidase with cupredoxin domain
MKCIAHEYFVAIVVTDPNNEDEKQLREMYDEEAILFLQDWYHLDGQARRTGLDSFPFIWIGDAQSFVINGGGIFEPCLGNETDGLACADNCSMDNYVKTLEVAAGKTYRLRLVGGQELIGVNFAIQGHKMKVVEVEGTIVEPFEVDNLDIMPAQRYSVLVTMDQEPDQYMATTTTRYRKGGPTGYIAIKYSGSPDKNITSDGLPEHPAWDDVQPTVDLESQLFTKNVDYYEDSDVLSAEPESIRRIIIVGTQAKDEVLDKLRWTMNNVTMTMMNSAPVIVSAYDAVHADGSASWPETEIEGTVVVPDSPPNTWNYTEPVQDSVGVFNGDRGSAVLKAMDGEVIEVVMQNSRALNGVAEMHSFHLHGHSFYVVGMGFGTFDEENDVETYNLVNPVRRDTLALLPLGWTAFRFKANNPGVWSYHCTQVGIYRV